MRDEIRSLVGRCLDGDRAAVGELVRRFQAQVFGLCYRMLGCRHDAEDVTQESLLRAVRGLRRFDTAREFEPWLLAIAGNRCRTHLSTRKRRPLGGLLPDDVADRAPDEQAAAHLDEEIQLALATLRPEHRQAFLLFHEHEMNYADIAETLGIPLGTVKTWVHRARLDLIRQLQERGVVAEASHAVRSV